MKIRSEIVLLKVSRLVCINIVAKFEHLLGKEAVAAIDELIDGR